MKLFRLPPISLSEVKVAFLEAAESWSKILLLQVETGQWAGVWAGHCSRPRWNAKSTGLGGLGAPGVGAQGGNLMPQPQFSQL